MIAECFKLQTILEVRDCAVFVREIHFSNVFTSLTNRTNLVSKQFNIRKGFLFLYQPEYLKPIEPASFFSNVLLKIANFIFFENASLLI